MTDDKGELTDGEIVELADKCVLLDDHLHEAMDEFAVEHGEIHPAVEQPVFGTLMATSVLLSSPLLSVAEKFAMHNSDVLRKMVQASTEAMRHALADLIAKHRAERN